MYWPAALTIATSTSSIAWSSSARPLTKILPSGKTVPSIGCSSASLSTGGWSPG